MKTADEFKLFYDQSLLPVLTELDKERKAIIKRLLKFFLWPFGVIFGAILIGGGVLGMAKASDFGTLAQFAFPVATFPSVIIGGIATLLVLGRIRKVKLRFKNDVIAGIVKSIDPSLAYAHDRSISDHEYHKSKLFLQEINRYKGEDFVGGTVGKTAISFSELKTQFHKVTHRNGKREETTTTIFRGMFFVADFNKKFIRETVVLPDTAEKMFGSLGTMFQKMNMNREQLVKLEDPEFEKEFAVYSGDQVEARYILSTALMQRILEFKKKTRKTVRMSFIDSRVYIAISINDDLFEPPIFTSMINFDLIKGFHNYLILFTGIVEDLNLNTRIWTKE